MASGLPTTSIIPPDQSSFYRPLPASSSFRLLYFPKSGPDETTGTSEIAQSLSRLRDRATSVAKNVRSGLKRLSSSASYSSSSDEAETENRSTTLKCYLQVYEIGHHPPFRALSYTWGQPYYSSSRDDEAELPEFTDFDWSIICNGQPFRMSKNLFNAVATLVNAPDVEYLWIDAVCINQSDIMSERPQQVSLMGRIFGAASEVLVWVGHHTDQVDSFLWSATSFVDAVEQVVEERGETFVFNHSILDPTLLNLLGLEEQFSTTIRQLQQALDFYGRCRIFDRVWVVPELSQAKRPRVFCGDCEIKWENLRRLGEWFDRSSWNGSLANIKSEYYTTSAFMQQRFCGTVKTWNSLRLPQNVERTQRALYGAESWSQRVFATLLIAVSHLRSFRASDPRDHIFAALSLPGATRDEATQLVMPNYTASAMQVYTEFAVNSLRHLPMMSILWHLDQSQSRLQTMWPSWVPDWRRPAVKPISVIAFECSTVYNVWANMISNHNMESSEISISIKKMQLFVMAVPLSSIEAVAMGTKQVMFEQQLNDQNLARLLGRLKLCHCLPNTYQFAWDTPKSRVEALWRTMILDCTLDGDCPPPEEWKFLFSSYVASVFGNSLTNDSETITEKALAAMEFVYGLEEECTSGEIPSLDKVKSVEMMLRLHATTRPKNFEPELQAIVDKAQHFRATLSSHLRDRLLYRAENGLLGSGPALAQPGDQIWLLQGLNTPVILRPTGIPDQYKIVGESYLHGCMRGELFLHGILDRESAKPIVIV